MKFGVKTIDRYGRTCNACGDYKTWENYQKDKHSKTGHMACCKTCKREKKPSKVPRKERKPVPLEGFCPKKQAFLSARH